MSSLLELILSDREIFRFHHSVVYEPLFLTVKEDEDFLEEGVVYNQGEQSNICF